MDCYGGKWLGSHCKERRHRDAAYEGKKGKDEGVTDTKMASTLFGDGSSRGEGDGQYWEKREYDTVLRGGIKKQQLSVSWGGRQKRRCQLRKRNRERGTRRGGLDGCDLSERQGKR